MIIKTQKQQQNNMAYRRRRQPEQARTAPGSPKQKTKSYRVPFNPAYSDPSGEAVRKTYSLNTNRGLSNNCQLLSWGDMNALSPEGVVGGLPTGPDIALNVKIPTQGQYSGISQEDFDQYWGVEAPGGGFPLPASATLNLDFKIKVWASGGLPDSGAWDVLSSVPAMMPFFFKIGSKARVVKRGVSYDALFELKNFYPHLIYTSNPDQAGGIVQYSEALAQEGVPAYEFHFSMQDVPLSKCLWSPIKSSSHSASSSPSFINGRYGADANWGLNMNASSSFTQVNGTAFSYGDQIIIDPVSIAVNPFWGLTTCSYSVAIDTDGDGAPDNYFGNTVNSLGQRSDTGSSGFNLRSMVPSEPKTLRFVK